MENFERFIKRESIAYVLDAFAARSDVWVEDLMAAYRLICDNAADEHSESVRENVEYAYALCRYTDADIQDIVAMLLYNEYLNSRATFRLFGAIFGRESGTLYFNHMVDACNQKQAGVPNDRSENIRAVMVTRVCDRMFGNLLGVISQTNTIDAITVTKAYALLKEVYGASARRTGEPYIVRPVRVADHLSGIGVDGVVIATALLYAAVENRACTVEEVRNRCGAKIARQVEVMVSIHTIYSGLSDSVGEANLSAGELDRLIRHVATGDEMVTALFIRAADMICTLSSVTVTPENDLIGEQSEFHYYLTLLRTYKIKYFEDKIEDLIWRARDIDRYRKMDKVYRGMLNKNRPYIQDFTTFLRGMVNEEFNRRAACMGTAGFDVEILERDYVPLEIYNLIKHQAPHTKDLESRITKRHMPICDVDIILDPRDASATMENFVTLFTRAFRGKNDRDERVITRFYMDDADRGVLEIEDHRRNVFRCCISLRKDFIARKFGPGINLASEAYDEFVQGEKITVMVNGKNKVLPKGASVIDAAFTVRSEVGLSLRSASINGRKMGIYHTLMDGDDIVLDADASSEDGMTYKFVLHARISWLDAAVTPRARKTIMDYLSLLYEDVDPGEAVEAQDAVVADAADDILGEWGTFQL